MRVLYWHGWLLEGTGSNVYSARVAAAWRRAGHEVLLLSQQHRVDRLDFVDAWGTVDGQGVDVPAEEAGPGPGRVIALRPDIGELLPVFVYDAYQGFRVKRFVDLASGELRTYLERNVAALAAAATWRPPDAVVSGHAMVGPVVARRALGDRTYVAKVHGSDLEYAARLQDRYADLAREGLEGALRVTGASRDVLRRARELAPGIETRTEVVPPGVEVDLWRPRDRRDALGEAAGKLDADPEARRGRPDRLDVRVGEALAKRDGEALGHLATTYDQSVPDPGAAVRLRALADGDGPLIGYLGKLIPEKGVERFVEAVALLGPRVRGVVIGFGLFREWLTALVAAVGGGDEDAFRWLGSSSSMQLELRPEELRAAKGLAERLTFTGRLDHRYAPLALAALDVLVVPSTLEEAFGMVAAEGAAAGALPLVARHSALAEVAEALEGAAGVPGLLSFDPGPGATRRLAAAATRILELSPDRRNRVREAVRRHVASEWTWERTAERLLRAAAG